MIKFIYTIFLGLLIALFVGLGISTFYEGPKAPEYPTTYETSKSPEPTAVQVQRDKEYQAASDAYQNKSEAYSRNVSIIALIAAIALLAGGFRFEKRNAVIGGGVVLGGLFTLIYSILRGFVSTDTKYTFIVVSFGVLMAIYLGYRKFSTMQQEHKTSTLKKIIRSKK